MIHQLRALRDVSETLRESALEKTALVPGLEKLTLKRVGKSFGKLMLRNPGKTLVGGLGLLGAYGKAKSTMPGFNPEIQRLQLGIDQ